MRERRIYSLPSFRGMDLTTDAHVLSGGFAREAKNWVSEGGILKKRRGWAQCAPRLPSAADGVFSVSYYTGETLLAYAGGKFYALAGDLWEELPVQKTVAGIVPTPEVRRIRGFYSGGYLYLVGTGVLLRYGKFGEAFEVRTVEPYVPTTTVGISPEAEGDSLRTSYEYANLLTPVRKNTLFGGSGGCVWHLDSAVAPEPITVEATVFSDGVSVTRRFHDRPEEAGNVQLYDEAETVVGSIDRYNGILRLLPDTTPPGSLPNVTVTFTVGTGAFLGVSWAGQRAIYGCSFGTLFGVGGAKDRLFLSGNSEYPNTVFFSERDDFSYFPDEFTVTLGSDGSAVKGFLPLSDGSLAVFKSQSRDGDATVYYLFGSYRTYGEGLAERTLPVFSIRAGAAGEELTGAFSAVNLAGDSLFLSRNGVFGIEQMQNVGSDTRCLYERSRAIRERLRSLADEDAVMAVHGKYLYLAAGEGCFAACAESRHRDSETGGMTYDWFYFTPMRAHIFFEWNLSFCFCDGDGRICTLDAADCDETFEELRSGELGFDYTDGSILFSNRLSADVTVGRELTLVTDGVYTALTERALRVSDRRIFADTVKELLTEGAEVYVKNGGEVLREGVPYYVRDPNPAEGSFSLSGTREGETLSLAEVPLGVCFFRPITRLRLTVREVNTAVGKAWVSLGADTPVLCVAQYFLKDADSGVNLVPTNPRGVLHTVRPIVAEWVTPYLALGGAERKKTLLSMTARALGCVRVIAESRREVRGTSLSSGDFSFADTDFSALSFTGAFEISKTVPLRMRGCGEVLLRFCAEGKGDAAVLGAALCFRETTKRKGVT